MDVKLDVKTNDHMGFVPGGYSFKIGIEVIAENAISSSIVLVSIAYQFISRVMWMTLRVSGRLYVQDGV